MAASKQASKQASKHTYSRAQCSHASVGLAQACPNYSWKPKDTEVMVKNPQFLLLSCTPSSLLHV